MDAGLLKAFLEVNRSRHFGRAADNLFISQSAISARIKQLEEELGQRLFTRDRNNIELTAAGTKFLKYAESILNTWNRARQEIAIPDGVHTLLSIAAVPSIWDIFLEDWLAWTHKSNASTALNTDVMRSDSIMRNLLDGTIDLIRENYIFVDWGTSFTMFHARQYPDAPPPVLRAGIGRIALSFIQQCGGAAYLPEAMIEDHLGSSLNRVEDAPVIHKEAYAVYSKSSNKLHVIDDVLKWFDQHY